MQLFSLSEMDRGHTQARDFVDELGNILPFLCMGNNQCKKEGSIRSFLLWKNLDNMMFSFLYLVPLPTTEKGVNLCKCSAFFGSKKMVEIWANYGGLPVRYNFICTGFYCSNILTLCSEPPSPYFFQKMYHTDHRCAWGGKGRTYPWDPSLML